MANSSRGTLLLSTNVAWNVANFRMGLIRALQRSGWRVVVVAAIDDYCPLLESNGVEFVSIPVSPRGVNPFSDLRLLFAYLYIFIKYRPFCYLGFTVKPNIYGSIAARLVGIELINNIAGLGSVFVRDGLVSRLVAILYKFSLRSSRLVFFQNEEDLLLFKQRRIVVAEQARRLPGSGVDLTKFVYKEVARNTARPFIFLMACRLLWEKGVAEYVQAARKLKAKYPHQVEFRLLGFLGNAADGAVTQTDISGWEAEGVVRYLGVSDQVSQEISACDCVVLPSYYREGVPRVLLEAAAVGRPIVTTNCVGCKDAVVDGHSGFLCSPRDIDDLTIKMEMVFLLDFESRVHMGRMGRQHVEDKFDQNIIVKSYLDALDSMRV